MQLSFRPTAIKTALLAIAAPMLMAGANAATITISCGSVGQDFEFCKRHTEEWAKKTGHTVKLFTLPQSTTDLLGLYRQMFAAKSGDVDIINVDVVWPGMTGRPLADEARRLRPTLKVLFTTGYSRNAIVHQGRLDAGVQLISKPFTFEQLAARIRDVLDRRI